MRSLLQTIVALAVVALCVSAAEASVHKLDGNARFQTGWRFQGYEPYPYTLAALPDGPVVATPSATAVQTSGPSPKKLSLPPGAFTAPAQDVTVNPFLVGDGFVLQVHTAISAVFPETLTASGGAAGPAVFSAGGRTGATTETWCPGSGTSPPFACTDPSQGLVTGLLRYTATKSQFGGVARARLGGSADWAFRGGDVPPCTYGGGANKLCLVTMATAMPGARGVLGAPFGAQTAPPGDPPPSGKLYVTATALGDIVAATPTPEMVPGLPNPRVSYGGPWTTGMVTVSVTGVWTWGTEVHVLTGSDLRNVQGRGRISLVSGGIVHRSTGPNAQRGWLNLQIGPPPGAQVPGVGPAGLAALAVLTGGVGSAFLRQRAGGREE